MTDPGSVPRIICCGVALPSHRRIVMAYRFREPMPHDGLDFVFFLSVDHFRWRLMEVDPVFRSFFSIRC